MLKVGGRGVKSGPGRLGEGETRRARCGSRARGVCAGDPDWGVGPTGSAGWVAVGCRYGVVVGRRLAAGTAWWLGGGWLPVRRGGWEAVGCRYGVAVGRWVSGPGR
ncbi:hypothetical protein GCM10029976_076520 [Kribbella albertanoniae]